MPELALYNNGGGVAVVLGISGIVKSRNDSTETKLRWLQNVATDYVGTPETGTMTRFDSYPETIFVSTSEAVIRRLLFSTQHEISMITGEYELTVDVVARPNRGFSNLKRIIRIRPQDELFLSFHRPPSEGQMSRNLRFNFDEELSCYISELSAQWRPPAATVAGQ